MIGARNRDLSKRKALRKRRIAREIYTDTHNSEIFEYYDNLHQYSKNKIHCSCPLCSSKTKNKGKRAQKSAHGWNPSRNFKFSDLRKISRLDYEEEMA